MCREDNAQEWLTEATAHNSFSSTVHTIGSPPAPKDCQMSWELHTRGKANLAQVSFPKTAQMQRVNPYVTSKKILMGFGDM